MSEKTSHDFLGCIFGPIALIAWLIFAWTILVIIVYLYDYGAINLSALPLLPLIGGIAIGSSLLYRRSSRIVDRCPKCNRVGAIKSTTEEIQIPKHYNVERFSSTKTTKCKYCDYIYVEHSEYDRAKERYQKDS